MPPLNRFVEGQENNGAFRNQTSCHGHSRRASFGGLLESPVKSSVCERKRGLRRRVTGFLGQRQIRSVKCRNDYSEQEIKDCWYSDTDFAAFRQEALITLDVYKNFPSRIDGVEYTMRGLEHHLEKIPNRRNLLRMRARRVILDHQEFKGAIGWSTVEHVATMSSSVSKNSVLAALSIATLDQLAASQYQMEGTQEPFNDNWISCVSSIEMASSTLMSTEHNANSDVPGFDNSWLCDRNE